MGEMKALIANIRTPSGMATLSLVLGVLAVPACIIPRLGALLSLGGLACAAAGFRSPRRPLAIAGIIICGVALLLANMMGTLTGDCAPSPMGGT